MLRKICCGISGGVDSAVAAFLLKSKGYNVEGVFMQNWDSNDELGFCSVDQDRADAEYICNKLEIKLHNVEFIKQYWFKVFERLTHEYTNGWTPNPDICCNQHIKFNALLNHVLDLGFDKLATGHYAKIVDDEDQMRLMMPTDKWKDQTFFLSQVSQRALQRSMFPIGFLNKSEVKKIARDIGLGRIVEKKESMGICFIGKRPFQEFIDEYLPRTPGDFIDITTGKVVGQHKGMHHWTIGQRSRISINRSSYYVAHKDIRNNIILLAPGNGHSSLYAFTMYTLAPHWIRRNPFTGQRPEASPSSMTKLSTADSTSATEFRCGFRFQHQYEPTPCTLKLQNDGTLCVTLDTPMRALTGGQFGVFYAGEECLGSAQIAQVGPTLWELTKGLTFSELLYQYL